MHEHGEFVTPKPLDTALEKGEDRTYEKGTCQKRRSSLNSEEASATGSKYDLFMYVYELIKFFSFSPFSFSLYRRYGDASRSFLVCG